MKITLYGRVPSKKNSKQIVRWRIISSKNYLQWEKEQLEYLRIKKLTKQLQQINPLWPYCIELNIYLPDKRKTDIDNKTSSVLDLLVKSWIIADDSCEIIPKLIINFMWVYKDNPRIEIEILNLNK